MNEDGAETELSKLADTWNKLGTKDAMWAIYSDDPAKLGGGWVAEEFFETGRQEIAGVVAGLAALGTNPPFRKILDFGSGVGRLSRSLSVFAERVVAVDIAPSMIERGRALNAHAANIEWVLNQQPNLSIFDDETFELIYTNIVLQHMPTKVARSYIAEFFRITEKGGWVIFQLPNNEALTLRRSLENLVYNELAPRLPANLLLKIRKRRYTGASEDMLRDLPFMQMYGMKRSDVVSYVSSLGGSVERTEANNDAGAGWQSLRYFARKLPARA